MIHQRSTEESKVQFVENGNEGSENEIVGTGTGTEDPEIEIIGVVSDGKVFEKVFQMEDEEVHEILDGIDYATPIHNHHLNEHHNNHVAPAYNQVGLAHWNAHHDNPDNLPFATPTHNQVGLAHLNVSLPYATNNHVGLPHPAQAISGLHGGQSIPNGVHQMHHGGYPIHYGATQPMYFDGQSMQLIPRNL